MTPPERKWLEEINLLMQTGNFTPAEIHAEVVWAARWRSCSKCGVEAYEQCLNLQDISVAKRRPGYEIRKNKWPHEERVDREKLVEALKKKGYKLP